MSENPGMSPQHNDDDALHLFSGRRNTMSKDKVQFVATIADLACVSQHTVWRLALISNPRRTEP